MMFIQGPINLKLVFRASVASHSVDVIENSTIFMNMVLLQYIQKDIVCTVLTHILRMRLSLQKITLSSYHPGRTETWY